MKKRIITSVLLIAMLAGIKVGPVEADRIPGRIYVEIEKGIVLNEAGDGEIITDTETEYNYISYSGTAAEPGDMVYTFFFYNPLTSYSDDIIYRYDFVK